MYIIGVYIVHVAHMYVYLYYKVNILSHEGSQTFTIIITMIYRVFFIFKKSYFT